MAAKPQPFRDYAETLNRLGYSIIPIAPGQKRPALASDWQRAHEFQNRLLDSLDIYGDNSIGILTRGLAAIDIDVLDKAVAGKLIKLVKQITGAEHVPMRVGRFPKVLMLYRRAEGPSPKLSSAYYRSADGCLHRVEVLGDGQQFVAYGTHADTGRAYVWRDKPLAEEAVFADDLVEVTTEQLNRILDAFGEIADAQGWERISGKTGGVNSGDVPFPVAGLTLELAEDALNHVPNADLHYDEWLAVGMALHQQFNGYEEAFDLWNRWSSESAKDRGEAVNWKHWLTFTEDRPGGLTMRRFLNQAEEGGWKRPSTVEGAPVTYDDFPDLPDTTEKAPVAPSEADEFPQYEGAGSTENAKEAANEAAKPLKNRSGPWTPALDFAPDLIPKRRWVMPGFLMRGHVTGFAGPPGVSKSLFELARAVSVATGRELLGEPVLESGPVLLVNNEDDADELQRRLAGLQILHGIKNEELHGRLYFWSGYGDPVRFAEKRDRHSPLQRTKGVPKLVDWCLKKHIVALFVDPLISTARGAEENDNNDMDGLVSIWKGIADETQTAVSLTHHTRKSGTDSEGHAGDAQAFRGGGAFIGAVRLAHTLARMSKATERQLGLSSELGRRLVRADNAKSNYSLPDADAAWFQLETVHLPSGDTVGVPVPAELAQLEQDANDNEEGATIKDRELHLRRKRLVELFDEEIEAAGWNFAEIPLSEAASRWMGEQDCSKRTALDHIKRIVPEGRMDDCIVVVSGGALYDVWRESSKPGGRGGRVNVMVRKHLDGEDDWMQ